MNLKRWLTMALACILGPTLGAPAHAWHPATTQAGLAEKAALASRLHQVLARQLGRPLGLFEPVRITDELRSRPDLRDLWRRLMLLDPNDGTTPNETGANVALFWVTAGAILESTPPERERHHFFDPRDGRGLHDDPGATGTLHRLRLALDGTGGLRGIATGTSFDLTGRPALGWFTSAENELGLPAFMDALAATAGGEVPAARDAALAKALMCLGALGAVLGELGEPAHVRNDFRAAFLQSSGAGPWDQSSPFERFVARTYGRAGVPLPPVVVERPSLQSYFTAPDAQGLADRTQREFFSQGTLPEAIPIDAASTPKEVRQQANRSLRYPQPAVGPLQLRTSGRRYQKTIEGRRQLAYERLPDSVEFYLDEAVYEDTAAAWLPVVGGYVAGLFNHLLRVDASLSFKDSGGATQVTVNMEGFAGAAEGTVQVYAEDAKGRRSPIGTPLSFSAPASLPEQISASAAAKQAPAASSREPTPSPASGLAASQAFSRPAASSVASLTLTLPRAAARVAVSLRGQDAAGAFVAVAVAQVP